MSKSMYQATDTSFPWEQIKQKFKRETNLSDEFYESTIKPLRYMQNGNCILIGIPETEENFEEVSERYLRVFTEVIKIVTGKDYVVSFVSGDKIH